jgi:integrase
MPAKKNNKWSVDLRPNGKNGKRIRKQFDTKAEALRYENHIKSLADRGEWQPQQRDKRTLKDIAQDWFNYHGYTLKTGEERLMLINVMIDNMGNCRADQIDPLDFIAYRKKRLLAGITENHLNHELSYLKSCFNELIRVDNWKSENPYAKLKNLKFSQRQLTFLSLEQINQLLNAIDDSLNPDLMILVKICLSIGCRWGEAQKLTANDIYNGKIHLSDTKTGKNRSIPASADLIDEILTPARRRNKGRLFINATDSFQNALNRADIELPKGQRTHVLRHTFASHFMMNGGNILDLSKILGHQTIQMTMTYAHLSPEHLQEAAQRNPLILLGGQKGDKLKKQERMEFLN